MGLKAELKAELYLGLLILFLSWDLLFVGGFLLGFMLWFLLELKGAWPESGFVLSGGCCPWIFWYPGLLYPRGAVASGRVGCPGDHHRWINEVNLAIVPFLLTAFRSYIWVLNKGEVWVNSLSLLQINHGCIVMSCGLPVSSPRCILWDF